MKYYLLVLLSLNDFSSFVSAASFANVMSFFQLTALLAFYHARYFQFKVSTALVATSFGCSSLRYCHDPTSLADVMFAYVWIGNSFAHRLRVSCRKIRIK